MTQDILQQVNYLLLLQALFFSIIYAAIFIVNFTLFFEYTKLMTLPVFHFILTFFYWKSPLFIDIQVSGTVPTQAM